VEPKDDPLVSLANEALDKFSRTTLLGEFPVDLFPICTFLFLLPPSPLLTFYSALRASLGTWRSIQKAC
jgi:hypothetical protein